MADPFQSLPCLLKLIPGVLGRSVNFTIPKRFLCRRPVFPDYLSVSSDYVFRKFVKSSSKFVISLVFGGQLKLFKHEILGYVFIVSLFLEEGFPPHSLHKFNFFRLIAIYNFVWIIFGCSSSLKSKTPVSPWLC